MSELSPETEDLLARGREGTPLSASRRDELKGAVLAKIALGAGVAGTSLTATSTSAAAWTMTTKTIGVALIAAVIGTGTVGVVHYQRRAHAPQASKQASQPNDAAIAANDPAPAISSAASPIAVAPSLKVGSEAPQTLPIVQPTLDVAPPPIANPQTNTTPNSAPVVAHANVGSSTTTSSGSPKTANSQAIVSSPSFGSDPVFANGGSNGVATTAPHASSLEEETALLRSAHEALQANDPARALRLLDEHASRFPSGALEPEASADRVFALCANKKPMQRVPQQTHFFLRIRPAHSRCAFVRRAAVTEKNKNDEARFVCKFLSAPVTHLRTGQQHRRTLRKKLGDFP